MAALDDEPMKILNLSEGNVEQHELLWRQAAKTATTTVGLVLCLNLGVPPPGTIRGSYCAKLEAGIDPYAHAETDKALQLISKHLKDNYAQWLPKAEYKFCLDPSVGDVKTMCLQLRAAASHHRVLLHWNGHGVPRPTAAGETWAFSPDFRQYVPVSVVDLVHWVGSPAIFIFDCDGAAAMISGFYKYVEPKFRENCIIMAACSVGEVLPADAKCPADLLTFCLTCPIKAAIQWMLTRSILCSPNDGNGDVVPGTLTNRETPLGRLNWIFTAVTDAIAWDTLPRKTFRSLFRDDRMLASLFRNFLLAERIMRFYGCRTMSEPRLAPTHRHILWDAFDTHAETIILDALTKSEPRSREDDDLFFLQQMKAFEVWLDMPSTNRRVPIQLPILLQTILTKKHREQTLTLLARFVDLGPWTIPHILDAGFLPFIVKLTSGEIGSSMCIASSLTLITARILHVDKSCADETVRSNSIDYLLRILQIYLSCTQSASLSSPAHSPSPIRNRGENSPLKSNSPGATRRLHVASSPKSVVVDPTQRSSPPATPAPYLKGLATGTAASSGKSADGNRLSVRTERVEKMCRCIGTLATFSIAVMCKTPPQLTKKYSTGIMQVLADQLDAATQGASLTDSPCQCEIHQQKNWKNSTCTQRTQLQLWSILCGINLCTAHPALCSSSSPSALAFQHFSQIVFSLVDSPSPFIRAAVISFLSLYLKLTSPTTTAAKRESGRHGARADGPATESILTEPDSPLRAERSPVAVGESLSLDLDALCALCSSSKLGRQFAAVRSILRRLSDPSTTVRKELLQLVFQFVFRFKAVVFRRAAVLMQEKWQQEESRFAVASPRPTPTVSPAKPPSIQRSKSAEPVDESAEGLSRRPSRSVEIENNSFSTDKSRSSTLDSNMLHDVGSKFGASFVDGGLIGCSEDGGNQENVILLCETLCSEVLAALGALANDPIFHIAQSAMKALDWIQRCVLMQTTTPDLLTSALDSWHPLIDSVGGQDQSNLLWQPCANRLANPLMDTTPRCRSPSCSVASKSKSTAEYDASPRLSFTKPMPIKTLGLERICKERSIVDLGSDIRCTVLHPNTSLIAAADSSNRIHMWDYGEDKLTSIFSNTQPHTTPVSNLLFANHHGCSLSENLLLAASRSGVIRIWKGMCDGGYALIASGFQGLVTDEQRKGRIIGGDGSFTNVWMDLAVDGRLAVGGDWPYINIWDMIAEQCSESVRTENELGSVTSLSYSSTSASLLAAGFADGTVRIFDTRQTLSRKPVFTIRDHAGALLMVKLGAGGDSAGLSNTLVSGSTAGDVRIWDIRKLQPLAAFDVFTSKEKMVAVCSHSTLPVICASSAQNQKIKVVTHSGKLVNIIQGDQFLSGSSGPCSTMTMHPEKLLFAASFSNSVVSIYGQAS